MAIVELVGCVRQAGMAMVERLGYRGQTDQLPDLFIEKASTTIF